MKKTNLFLLLVCSCFLQIKAQTTSLTFAKLFNDTVSIHKYWWCADIVQSTIDSGYIAIGQYQNTTNNYNTVQYFKLDKNGNLVIAPIPEKGTEIAFTKFDIKIISTSFNDENEKNQLVIETILSGNIGQSLLAVNPAGFFTIAG